MIKHQLNLKGFDFQELQTPNGLMKLDRSFLQALQNNHPEIAEFLTQYRHGTAFAPPEIISQNLIQAAIFLEKFIAQLFNIEDEAALLQVKTLQHQPVFAFKAYYVLKQARRATRQPELNFDQLNQIIEEEMASYDLIHEDRELSIAKLGLIYLADTERYREQINRLTDWCISAMNSVQGRQAVAHWQMFKIPKKLNFDNLVDFQPLTEDPLGRFQGSKQRQRDGFHLTDARMGPRAVMSEIDYCVYCHTHQGDFCSKGFPVKKNENKQTYKSNILGELLNGCPLEEKISEMHVLKKEGFGIAALAVIMIDNPLCPMTGHRICNDCMKACIYQKQEPVNIPQTETGILTDVLNLPWGVEIYDLLTRWNPLRSRQWVLKPYNSLKVLVMGMGPAGFSLAHYLLMEGYAVCGMDGLKIEPLSDIYQQPIRHYDSITEDLAQRMVSGFGGVAEYGITVRWDKNFLKLIYISLMRRRYFQVIGCVRFGGTITVEEAWLHGFDHLALAVGAGLPKELAIPNSLAPGMRQANDFLMSLQLTGAAKTDSLAHLQIRLPAIVIGGGLTAVDTATEVQAYYIVQVEKTAMRYHQLVRHFGEDVVRSRFLPADLVILDEFLYHARQVAEERQSAQIQNRQPDFIRLLRRWGGVTIVYRRSLQQSPAYRRNPEELQKALEEGIYYAEKAEPAAVILDPQGQVQALRCIKNSEQIVFAARSIFVATGARLNVAYEFEHRGTFLRQHSFEYQRYENIHGHLRHRDISVHVKGKHFGAFTSYSKDHRRVSFLGDTHPVFHGSVVNAMASAARIYPEICALLQDHTREGDEQEYRLFREKIQQFFSAAVLAVNRLNRRVVELVVRAPAAVRANQGGQFYRLQNYETDAPRAAHTLLQMEGLALLGIPHPTDRDILSFYVIEKGAASRLVQHLKPGQPLALMGPTGASSSKILTPSTLLVIGDILAPAFLLSMREKFFSEGHRVWLVNFLENAEDIYAQKELESVAEKIIWITKKGRISLNRPQDISLENPESDVAAALQHVPDLAEVAQTWVIGSACLLGKVRQIFPKNVPVQGSVYGPMQCMLKGVCAQCLQWQIDPSTGKRSKAVYACSWQHQPLERIDIDHIDERLQQNRCQETLTDLWMDYLSL